MPRNYKLTWQPGASGRGGRWRKKYKGKSYYFDGGRGKTDRDSYDAALASWEQLKVKLDVAAPKKHQADYERAMGKWEQVLAWCRKHQEAEMADVATEKIASLRKHLSASRPRPVAIGDTFEGQFDWSVRFPGWDQAMKEIAALVVLPPAESRTEHSDEPLVIPPRNGWGDDPLRSDLQKWNDRLEIATRSAAKPEQTVRAQVAAYVATKQSAISASELSGGRAYTIQLHLDHFVSWLGGDTSVIEISGKTLSDYRLELLRRVEANDWSRVTAKGRMGTVKGFVHWLWQMEAIPTLPRVLDAKARALQIGTPSASIVVFTLDEISTLLAEASDRTTLYILLMLNCGMTQKDIADLQMAEVDWERRYITRKRSKTKDRENVPIVTYALWPETLRLLKQERSSKSTGLVLLNKNGEPLWYEEVQADGKLKKNDNIRNAFARLTQKTKINKPLKSLKKTSASLIRGNSKYASLESLFLGHAPQSMADKHYAATPQELLDEAIVWLGSKYGIGVS
ncbi:MAG: tyrosine-type recombinase/integrase [Planctomycetaceae bacterium]|nr:tyrosine-type recombinase/integrase [Planctomycetales bacterium]MCB9925511.1 tyrosine-type recombinase/integrase [Planctomycetaceae bacterium]